MPCLTFEDALSLCVVFHQVTRSGEFVFPLDSQHKKPYEVLVLGRYRDTAGKNSPRYDYEIYRLY